MEKHILPPPTKRRPGAPSGNVNALKHGFYSRQLRSKDLSDLETYQFSGLLDEITMLRVIIRRVIEMGKDVDNLPDALGLMRGLCFAVTSLTRLIKTQHLLNSPADEAALTISRAIDEVAQELGITERFYGRESRPTLGGALRGVNQPALDRPPSENAPPD